ncbi:PREDICTED: uncharacterized protein LOC108689754 [Atta colombica]|uniref:uncharacterized protein LOC108689754 n=1 Tax=Atta colombica TaxID=520822 RepID=UPI00084C535D|nr:PREDICTED: uncharacterized protein LOC108689754 [Atta colombica]
MPSLRVKYVLAHLSRTEHTALLARPNWRRLRRRDPNVLASPFTVRRRAILKSRASRRTRVMAQPKFVTKKYDPAAAPPLFPRIHPKTLAAKSTKRIVDLALPKRRRLLETRKLAATKNMKATVNDLLVKVRKSRYQRYRLFCNARQEREARKKRKRMAKLRRALTKPEDWQRHMRVLERLAAPKVVAKPKKRKPSKKRKWRPVNLERVYFLALPLIRKDIVLKDPFKVAEHALTYIISKRMERLSIRKIRPEIPLRIPGAVSPAAMKAIGSNTHFVTTFTTVTICFAVTILPLRFLRSISGGILVLLGGLNPVDKNKPAENRSSQRVIALAKPAKRPEGRETDLREDAFTVSPMALKAKCSKRLKNLAKPKTYPKPVFKRLRTALKR